MNHRITYVLTVTWWNLTEVVEWQ